MSLDPANVPAKWYVNPSNGLSRVHECDRRQTDDATEKRVAIGYYNYNNYYTNTTTTTV